MTSRMARSLASLRVRSLLVAEHAFLGPGLGDPVGQEASGGDEERAGAGGDVGDLEVEDRRAGLQLPRVLVVGLQRPRLVDQRLQRVQDDLLGQRAWRVVRAGVLARRRLDDDQAADGHHERDAAEVAPDAVAPARPGSPAARGRGRRPG